MKRFVIFAVLFAAASLANANLVQQNAALTLSKSDPSQHASLQTAVTQSSFKNSLKIVNTQILSHLSDAQFTYNNANKVGFFYGKLFDYTSHINQTVDHEGLAVFWKNTLIANAIDAVNAHKNWDAPPLLTGNENDILQIAANSLNDKYVSDAGNMRLNEVPLPAAAWLFTSAIVLFGFARRNNI